MLSVLSKSDTQQGRGTPMHGASPARVVDLGQMIADFVKTMPRRGSEAMDVPTSAQAAAFAEAITAAQSGRLEQARALLAPLSYEVMRVRDATSLPGSSVLVFRERGRDDDTWPHGWGLYLLRTDPAIQLAVQVPHPLYDVHTPEAGVEAFRHAHAQSLFVAGTHRYANADNSSDVAHNHDSMFAHVTRAVISPGSTVLQFHGFAEDGYPQYGGAVVSDGERQQSPQSAAVAGALRDEGVAVCHYDGNDCAGLAGTTNVQGRWARRIGATFLHVELVRHIRDDARARDQLARLVVDTLPRRP